MLDRAQAVSAIRAFGEELTRSTAARRTAGQGPDPHAMVTESFAKACAQQSVTARDLRAAIDADPSLVELEEAVTKEALADSADPGPYDAISRESPSGSTANRHLGEYGAAEVGQPVTPGAEGPKTP